MYTDYNEDVEENYYADDDKGNNGFDKEKLKRIIFFVIVFIILIILILVLVKGCSKKNNTKTNDDVVLNDSKPVIALSQTNLTLGVGETYELESDALDHPDAEVIWYQNDPTIVDVDEQGNITALSEGETEVIALYRENGVPIGQNSCKVVVTSKEVAPEKISLGQDEMSMKLGDSVLLQVSISPIEAKVSDLVFESEAPDIVSVDDKGYVKANSVGSTAIIVKTKDEKVSDSIIVKVTETGKTEINPTKIILFGLDTGLTEDSTSKMEYKLEPSNATNNEITWTSSNPDIATVEDGIVTGHKAGKCTIIATTENGLTAMQEVIVESDSVPVSSVNINGDTALTMPLGGTRLLRYTILPENATNKNVSYTVSNSSVLFVDSNGFIAAIGVGNSLVTITTEDGNKTAVVNVTVTNTSNVDISTTNIDDSTTASDNNDSSSNGSSTEDNSSSSSSTDDSSSSSSSSSNSSSGGSYTVSSSSSDGDSCGVNSFAIKSNQDGAVTSNNRFENAKPFTGANAGLKVTTYDSCINKSKSYYDLWYSNDVKNINTSKSPTLKNQKLPTLGNTLYLNKGDGYYYIKAYITTNDGANYYKYYYAIVKNGGKNSNTINITSTFNSTGTTFTIKNVSSSTIRLAACITKSSITSDKCTPQLNNSACASNYCQISGYKTLSKNSTTTYSITQNTSLDPTKTRGGKICFRAYDTTGNVLSDTQCEVVKKNTSTTSSTSISNYITLSPTTISNGGSFKITKKNSSVKKIYYCIRKDTSSCTPVVNKSGNSNGVYYSYITMSKTSINKTLKYSNTSVGYDKGVKICFKPFGESAFLTTQSVCGIVKK